MTKSKVSRKKQVRKATRPRVAVVFNADCPFSAKLFGQMCDECRKIGDLEVIGSSSFAGLEAVTAETILSLLSEVPDVLILGPQLYSIEEFDWSALGVSRVLSLGAPKSKLTECSVYFLFHEESLAPYYAQERTSSVWGHLDSLGKKHSKAAIRSCIHTGLLFANTLITNMTSPGQTIQFCFYCEESAVLQAMGVIADWAKNAGAKKIHEDEQGVLFDLEACGTSVDVRLTSDVQVFFDNASVVILDRRFPVQHDERRFEDAINQLAVNCCLSISDCFSENAALLAKSVIDRGGGCTLTSSTTLGLTLDGKSSGIDVFLNDLPEVVVVSPVAYRPDIREKIVEAISNHLTTL